MFYVNMTFFKVNFNYFTYFRINREISDKFRQKTYKFDLYAQLIFYVMNIFLFIL
jgi:hypothetical protein